MRWSREITTHKPARAAKFQLTGKHTQSGVSFIYGCPYRNPDCIRFVLYHKTICHESGRLPWRKGVLTFINYNPSQPEVLRDSSNSHIEAALAVRDSKPVCLCPSLDTIMGATPITSGQAVWYSLCVLRIGMSGGAGVAPHQETVLCSDQLMSNLSNLSTKTTVPFAEQSELGCSSCSGCSGCFSCSC